MNLTGTAGSLSISTKEFQRRSLTISIEIQESAFQDSSSNIRAYGENEKCWVVFGVQLGIFWIGKMHFLSDGDPCEVAFEADDVFARQDQKKDVLGFVHTHPNTRAYPSATDHATMEAWVTAMGKSLICGIIGTDGHKSYLYVNEESEPIEGRAFKIGNFVFGVNPIV